MTLVCPNCGRQDRQVKAGTTGGVQRYKCATCGRRYSLDTRPRAYAPTIRERAVEMHTAGSSIRKIATELSVSPQTVSNWLRTMPESGAEAKPPRSGRVIKPRNTIADVAKQASVSTSTVSNYLNDKGRMSHETRQRIGEAMKDLYFTPNALVRAIRHRQTHTLGLVSYGIYDLETTVEISPVASVIGSIYRAADQAGYDVLMYTGWPHRARSRTGSDFLNGQVDGLLWMSPHHNTSQLRFAAAGGLPVMSLLTRRVPSGVGYVVADNIGGVHELVIYLASRGHTRIAFLGSTFTSDFVDRAAGYRSGLAAAGLPLDPEIEATSLSLQTWTWEGVEPIVDGWLRMDDRPTAIVVVEDVLAGHTIAMLRERGVRVPEDVVVTGFNDIPAASHLQGGITTLRQPFGEMGRIAVERLDAMIHGAPLSECQVTVPVSLVIRASTEHSS
jgi:LacI family transcriptional regulator